jgi:hypothetical protein
MSTIFLKHWVTTGKCDAGMSVEKVPAVVNIKTLKGRFIAHKFSTGHGRWGGEECGKKRRVLLASLQSSIRRKRMAGLKTKQGRLRG